MAQNYTVNYFDSTSSEATEDLIIMENNFECLRSMFSGVGEPSDMVAGMPWFSTTTNGLRIRNNDNDAWMGVFLAEATTKVWMYSNVAEEGWIVDSSDLVYDSLIALKTTTGSNDYNTDGGNEAGIWTQPLHQLKEEEIPAHNHGNAGAHSGHTLWQEKSLEPAYGSCIGGITNTIQVDTVTSTDGAHTHSSIGFDTSHNHGSTFRPYAAVGTRQYMKGIT